MSANESGPALPLPVLCNACGRALANVGEWCCGRFTTTADVTAVERDRQRVKVSYPTREELRAKRDALLAKYPAIAMYPDEGSLVGEEWMAWAELGDINWLLGGES